MKSIQNWYDYKITQKGKQKSEKLPNIDAWVNQWNGLECQRGVDIPRGTITSTMRYDRLSRFIESQNKNMRRKKKKGTLTR
jgi:hypothetical protein